MYKNNGCKDCSEDKMCPRCENEFALGMMESSLSSIDDLVKLQEEIGDYEAAMRFWDKRCRESMLKVEYFREKLKEQNAKMW